MKPDSILEDKSFHSGWRPKILISWEVGQHSDPNSIDVPCCAMMTLEKELYFLTVFQLKSAACFDSLKQNSGTERGFLLSLVMRWTWTIISLGRSRSKLTV